MYCSQHHWWLWSECSVAPATRVMSQKLSSFHFCIKFCQELCGSYFLLFIDILFLFTKLIILLSMFFLTMHLTNDCEIVQSSHLTITATAHISGFTYMTKILVSLIIMNMFKTKSVRPGLKRVLKQHQSRKRKLGKKFQFLTKCFQVSSEVLTWLSR